VLSSLVQTDRPYATWSSQEVNAYRGHCGRQSSCPRVSFLKLERIAIKFGNGVCWENLIILFIIIYLNILLHSLPSLMQLKTVHNLSLI
jgi:hypothetical protein